MEFSAILPLPDVRAADRPAAFFALAGRQPVVRLVRDMLSAVSSPAQVVVAAAPSLIDEVRKALVSQGLPAVSVVDAAGSARADCLTAALNHLESRGIATSHVLVYEVAQLLTPEVLRDRVIAGLRGGGVFVAPALAVTDSIKAVDERGSVISTVDRASVRTVQYPRGFSTRTLVELLARRRDAQFDELALAVDAAVPITVVDGDADAFLAELPRDAEFVEAVIESPHAR
ncbi:IspD/TarI family cytidylyltransferase [Mycolicibacterium sp. XJ1819]